jgi:5'-nucleotidase
MRILVDMDGVIADCMSHWLTLINRYHGENLKPGDITGWAIEDFCKTAKAKQVYRFLRQPGFFRHLDPIPGALEAMNWLMRAGYDVVIVTACKYGQVDKQEWLKAHLPEFNLHNLIFAARKELVQGDVLIDDGMHNLEEWGKAHPNGLPICFAHPHNLTYEGERVYSWKQVLLAISGFENQRLDEARKERA